MGPAGHGRPWPAMAGQGGRPWPATFVATGVPKKNRQNACPQMKKLNLNIQNIEIRNDLPKISLYNINAKIIKQLVNNYNVDTVLINCNPLKRTENALSIISNNWKKRWGIYPNLGVGEPSPDGNIKEIHSDEEFLHTYKNAIKLGASVIGGCCGSTPKHIKLLKKQSY